MIQASFSSAIENDFTVHSISLQVKNLETLYSPGILDLYKKLI